MTDDDVLSLLAESLDGDGPPGEAMEAAYAAHAWRDLDAELALLIDDAQAEVVGFRGGGFSRVVGYESRHGTVEVSIDGEALQITVEPRPEGLVLRWPDRDQALAVDDAGRSSAGDVSGSIRLEVTWPSGRVCTPWVTL